MTVSALGVIIVTFNSADVILDCLESLLKSRGLHLHIAVVDNASSDSTLTVLKDWASAKRPYAPSADMPFALVPTPKPLAPQEDGTSFIAEHGHRLSLIEGGVNAGFAAGVNKGLAYLSIRPEIDRFWVLNPDCAVPPGTALAFASESGPAQGFSVMGGRVIYLDNSNTIQIDGGWVNKRTGVTGNVNLGAPHSVPPPDPAGFDFITGASMIVSRAFYEKAGPMSEDYFLYYEEVDWALRRGELPLAYCADGIVYHRAGTAIGSPTMGRPASPFSLYFKHRGRLQFMRRHFPKNLILAYAYSCAKAVQLLAKGYPSEAYAVFSASFGLSPIAAIRARLSPEAANIAFRVGEKNPTSVD